MLSTPFGRRPKRFHSSKQPILYPLKGSLTPRTAQTLQSCPLNNNRVDNAWKWQRTRASSLAKLGYIFCYFQSMRKITPCLTLYLFCCRVHELNADMLVRVKPLSRAALSWMHVLVVISWKLTWTSMWKLLFTAGQRVVCVSFVHEKLSEFFYSKLHERQTTEYIQPVSYTHLTLPTICSV